MRDPLDRRLRWLFGGAAVAFALAPGAIRLALAGRAGPAMPLSEQVTPWAALAVSFSVTAAILAARVARAPRRETFVMLVLAAGLGAGGGTLVGSWITQRADGSSPAVPAAGAAVALLGALAFATAWLRLWLAALPGEARQRRDEALLVALLDTLVPAGGAAEIGAADRAVRERVLSLRAAARGAVGIRLELRLLDLASRVLARVPLVEASADARTRVLDRLFGSRVGFVRRIVLAWRRAAFTGFYGDARVQRATGFDRAYLERRLVEGPNRELHRARLERGRRAGSDEATAAEPATGPAAPLLRLIRTGGSGSA